MTSNMRRFALPLVLALAGATTQLITQHVSGSAESLATEFLGTKLKAGTFEVALGPYGLARYRASR